MPHTSDGDAPDVRASSKSLVAKKLTDLFLIDFLFVLFKCNVVVGVVLA